jgi:choline-glycine betaine transporter
VGRLENIIARNQRGRRPKERVVVSLVFSAIVLLILALMVFTDLGLPPEASQGAVVPRPARGKHVDGVLLRTAPASR